MSQQTTAAQLGHEVEVPDQRDHEQNNARQSDDQARPAPGLAAEQDAVHAPRSERQADDAEQQVADSSGQLSAGTGSRQGRREFHSDHSDVPLVDPSKPAMADVVAAPAGCSTGHNEDDTMDTNKPTGDTPAAATRVVDFDLLVAAYKQGAHDYAGGGYERPEPNELDVQAAAHAWDALSQPAPVALPAVDEVTRLRELAAFCYAGLVAECGLPDAWADAFLAAGEGKPFTTDGLLPFTAPVALPAVDEAMVARGAEALWNAESHRLLEQAGYPTTWAEQTQGNRRDYTRRARRCLTAAHTPTGATTDGR